MVVSLWHFWVGGGGRLMETLEGEGPWKEVIGGVLGRDFWVPGSLFLSFPAAYASESVHHALQPQSSALPEDQKLYESEPTTMD